MRKAVQWHWRQMSLLGRAWPDEFAVRVTAARELSQMLGDDHDLAMLIDVTARAEDIIRRGQGSHRRVMSASPTCVAQRRRTPRRAAFRRDAGGVHKAHGRVLALWPDCRSGTECLAGRRAPKRKNRRFRSNPKFNPLPKRKRLLRQSPGLRRKLPYRPHRNAAPDPLVSAKRLQFERADERSSEIKSICE